MKNILSFLITVLIAGVMTVQGQNYITCLKPDGLTASEITQNSAVLTWNATDNATYYIVELLSGNVP
ncbi:MAG: hypothetical protein KA792_09025, partial [Bacteroidales bacterium]|nr:hypothetical protein [Bacteroidales bacterium]